MAIPPKSNDQFSPFNETFYLTLNACHLTENLSSRHAVQK